MQSMPPVCQEIGDLLTGEVGQFFAVLEQLRCCGMNKLIQSQFIQTFQGQSSILFQKRITFCCLVNELAFL